MNLLCPHCQKTLTVESEFAGQLMKCPHCANTFTTPSLLKPAPPAPESVAPAATPPRNGGTAPPQSVRAGMASDSPPPPLSEPPALSQPSGYARHLTFSVSPDVVPWIAPLCLALVFVLSFFSWLRILTDPLTEAVRTESAWESAFNYGNGLLILYLLLFILALVAALAAVILPRVPARLPRAVQQIMPWRSGIVAGLVLLAFLSLFLQMVKGFAEEKGFPVAAFAVQRTGWLRLAATLHLAAVVSAALEFWLMLRKSRPLPRVDISW